MPKVKAQIKPETPEQNQEINQNQIQPIETTTDSSSDYEKIEELKNETEQVENEPTIKRKRGRPKKTETEAMEPQLPDINVAPVFNIIIDRLPNPLPLSESESSVLNSTFNKVLHKYSGDIKYIEEINLSLVLVGILLPRLKKQNNSDEKA